MKQTEPRLARWTPTRIADVPSRGGPAEATIMIGAFLSLAGAEILGALLGLAFLGGLWLTVDALVTARRPARRLTVSLVLRLGTAVTVFFLLARHAGWSHLFVATSGFVLARLFTVRHSARQGAGRGCRQ